MADCQIANLSVYRNRRAADEKGQTDTTAIIIVKVAPKWVL